MSDDATNADAVGTGTAAAAARRLAQVVREVAERPAGIAQLREGAKAIAGAVAGGEARLAMVEGALQVDGASPEPSDDDIAFLSSRLAAFGVEELVLTGKAAPADMIDLVKALSATPGPDAPAAFAARAAVIDARTIPRRLVARLASAAESLPVPSPAPARPSASRSPTPSSGVFATGAIDRKRSTTPGPVIAHAAGRAEDEGDALEEAPSVPRPADPRLAALLAALEGGEEFVALRAALDDLAVHADLAFRTGQDDVLLEALTGLVAIEHAQLARDPSDERRQAFTYAVRRLARPVLLRHLAVLRHRRMTDEVAVTRLQAVLRRFGTDGAEAVIDEHACAPTLQARNACLAALRGMRRALDALHAIVRTGDAVLVRHAAEVLGQLGGRKAEELLVELLAHADASARRAAVAALARLGSEVAMDGLRVALGDEVALVRARAVSALATPGNAKAVPMLAPRLDAEPDREVLYAVVAALGTIGGPESVQLLIRVAQGETEHAHRRSASYRTQACTALVAIRTPAAMACVQGLANDRDRDVRDAAVRLVAQAQRRTTHEVQRVEGRR